MRSFVALATDYDGTIAHDGILDDLTRAALESLKRSGRKLILVTGRELPDLERVCPGLDLFDRVVAENGALLYVPATKEQRPLGPPPPPGFVAHLQSLGMHPLSVGAVIVATWEPNEAAVLETIRQLGLDLQIIFNKGAVMVLPNGINKASGLAAALVDLGLSPHDVVATGDAENDLAFMRTCGCAVAVGNALPAVMDVADVVTDAPRGAGVAELVERWLDREDTLLEAATVRHSVPIGTDLLDGREVMLRPGRGNILITGTSGGGKSTLATALLERLADAAFEVCVFDPEGDYGSFADAVTFGDADAPIAADASLAAIRQLGTNVVLNLLGSGVEDRPVIFDTLYPAILEIRAMFGRPHWVLVDEAHHMLPRNRQAVVLDDRIPTILVTVHPDTLAETALLSVDTVLLIGRESLGLVETLSRAVARPCPVLPERGPDVGEAIHWAWRTDTPPSLIKVEKPKGETRRHTRKYGHGTLGEDRSFFFRGPDERLNIRAHNLSMFVEIGDGVDDATYLHHLRGGDFATWLRTSIKDEELADEIAGIASSHDLDVATNRRLVRQAIERRYTAPADPL